MNAIANVTISAEPIASLAPVVVDFAVASVPRSEIALRVAAEAHDQIAKLTSATDKKAGVMKTLAMGRNDLFQINPYLLRIKPDWNSRDANDPSNAEHIDMLARSIAASGVWQPLTVIVEDDVLWVTDGHCRLLATLRAIEVYNAEIKSIPVRGERKFGSEADRVLGQIVRNSGKPLTVLETGAVFVKLIGFGWTPAQIAEKSGLVKTRVAQILDLVGSANDGIKALVGSGAVSASTAALTLRKAGNATKAEKTLREGLTVAKAAGKSRATLKHIKVAEGDSGKVSIKKLLRSILESRSTRVDKNGKVTIITLSTEDFERLNAEVHAQLG